MSPRLKRGKHKGYSPRNVECDDKATYLRFIVPDIDEDSQRELGVFHAVRRLERRGKLATHEDEECERIMDWFSQNLTRPTRFTASKPPYYRKQSKAISWFKATAQEHVSRVRSLVAILQNHGVPVKMLRTNRVGYVVYEDEFQIVAEPFAGEEY